jgi:lysophospholipase L1-like esterase
METMETATNRMANKRIATILVPGLTAFLFFVFLSIVLRGGTDLYASAYPFLKTRSNKIQNAATGMKGFYEKLHILKSHGTGKPTILHIGDSHIQSGLMTGVIREGLQATFGNAGRGLIFPYSLAKTNGPDDLETTSNVDWDTPCSAWPTGDMPTGISGLAISTPDVGATIDIAFSDNTSMRNAFNKITIYYEKEPEAFEFQIANDASDPYGDVSSVEATPYTTTFILPTETSHIQLVVKKTMATQKCAILYGIALENGKDGVLYDTAGINGASFKTFNESAYFIPHLNIIKPDLIIISLGSNDVGENNFDLSTLRTQIDGLVQSILKDNPDISILFTLPPDFGKAKNKLLKQRILKARNVIISYCKSNGFAYWDLYKVMGGYGSIKKWQKSSLVQRDVMHFKRAGYELQGHLFFEALMKGLKDYESNRPE